MIWWEQVFLGRHNYNQSHNHNHKKMMDNYLIMIMIMSIVSAFMIVLGRSHSDISDIMALVGTKP